MNPIIWAMENPRWGGPGADGATGFGETLKFRLYLSLWKDGAHAVYDTRTSCLFQSNFCNFRLIFWKYVLKTIVTFVRARLTIWLIRRYCRRPKALRPVCPHLLPPQGLFKSICSKLLVNTTFFRQSCDTNLHACRKMPPEQSIDSKLWLQVRGGPTENPKPSFQWLLKM